MQSNQNKNSHIHTPHARLVKHDKRRPTDRHYDPSIAIDRIKRDRLAKELRVGEVEVIDRVGRILVSVRTGRGHVLEELLVLLVPAVVPPVAANHAEELQEQHARGHHGNRCDYAGRQAGSDGAVAIGIVIDGSLASIDSIVNDGFIGVVYWLAYVDILHQLTE